MVGGLRCIYGVVSMKVNKDIIVKHGVMKIEVNNEIIEYTKITGYDMNPRVKDSC